MLGDDLEAWMAESSMLRRTFRNVAVVAGLIPRQQPGANATRRQVTVNSDLVYDVLRRHQPDHVLLRATRQEAGGGLTDVGRLSDLLARISGRIQVKRLARVSPLAVPVMLDIGQESVRSEEEEDSLLAETEALVAEALGEAEPSTEAMHVGPGPAKELRRLTRQPRPFRPGRSVSRS
jgi:ATP-dependent Lhr-like helicase